MAVEIGVSDGASLNPAQDEPTIWLTSDGYYWFLHPLIERLRTDTGQYIDLYGDAVFLGPDLVKLKQTLVEARALVQSQPLEWDVHVRTQISPSHKELYSSVERSKFLQLIDSWEEIIERAQALNRPVVCFGD